VDGYITSWQEESDHDLHVTLVDVDEQRTELIVEIPDGQCQGACRSGYTRAFAAARRRFYERINTATVDTIRMRVMGVGFFDRSHGQLGAAPNLIELHPVLALEFP
jgi:hypothetical protein